MSRIGLVGAGYISRVHADVIRGMAGHTLSAVVDPNLDSARALAGSAPVFASVAEAVAAKAFDRAHVLVPPDKHEAVGLELLQAGIPVLLEKPLADGAGAGADRLVAASGPAARLGVNQNFVFHPAYARLRRAVQQGELGRPRYVGCTYNVPLRQLGAQAVRPLDVPGSPATSCWSKRSIRSVPDRRACWRRSAPVRGPGWPIHRDRARRAVRPASLNVSMQGEPGCPRSSASPSGQEFPFWQIEVVCDDGGGGGRHPGQPAPSRYNRTRWLPAVDEALSGLRTAGSVSPMHSMQGRAELQPFHREGPSHAVRRFLPQHEGTASPPSTTRWTHHQAPELDARVRRRTWCIAVRTPA